MSGNKTPKVSLLMPVFNMEKYVSGTLDTVISQTWSDFEVVVKDGGSKDGTVRILNEYAERDPRIKVISEPDEGPYDAILKAFKASRGEYVEVMAFSDGYFNKDWMRLCVETMDNDPEISLVWGIPFSYDEKNNSYTPHFIYSHFLEPSARGKNNSGNIILSFAKRVDLLHPLRTLKKLNSSSLGLVRRSLRAEEPPQKEAWFKYWLETGVIFPDGNMCMSRKAFAECMPPHEVGTKDPGDWMRFYFDFNSRGFLSYCLPVPANFARTTDGVSTVFERYNDERQADYYSRLLGLKGEIRKGKKIVFVDRQGKPIKK